MTWKPLKLGRRPPLPLTVASISTIIGAAAALALGTPTVLLWNASASVPQGLYSVSRADRLVAGALVVTRLPAEVRMLADSRHYLPLGVPLIKPVAGVPGQIICRSGARISVDGKVQATALWQDSRARNLPVWSGCRMIGRRQIFLMNPAVSDSFDGRYFGATDQDLIIGRATPLYIPRTRP